MMECVDVLSRFCCKSGMFFIEPFVVLVQNVFIFLHFTIDINSGKCVCVATQRYIEIMGLFSYIVYMYIFFLNQPFCGRLSEE